MTDLDASSGPGSQATPEAVPSSPSGFDPSRIAEAVAKIEPTHLAPVIKRAAEDFYVQVLASAEDYLRDNLDWNLKAHLKMLERENQRMRTELYDIRRMVGNWSDPQPETLQAIAHLDRRAAQHSELLYAVAHKWPGETRHETALRYIRERETASGIEAQSDETPVEAAQPAGREPVPKGTPNPSSNSQSSDEG